MKYASWWMAAIGCVVSGIVILAACSKSGKDGASTDNTGNKDAVLVNLGTNIILPAYQQLKESTTALDAAVTAFNAAPAAATLLPLQTAFKNAYISWAACSEFEFGPATDLLLNTHFINSFPTDTVVIKNNMGGAAYAIDGAGNYAAQGFPAMDYLLFAYGNNEVLARFTTAANAAGARKYLAALSASLKGKADKVTNAWAPTGDNYLSGFMMATGTNAGSSLSLLVNAYIMDFDVTLQNYKMGIPIGIYGPAVLPKSPEKVEGYYSQLSVTLLKAQVQALQHIYAGGQGQGLDDKVAATPARKNGGSLNDAIKDQQTALLSKIQALPDPLPDGIRNNVAAITNAYTEIRKMTVLLKVDMCAALGIRISFQDDDGD